MSGIYQRREARRRAERLRLALLVAGSTFGLMLLLAGVGLAVLMRGGKPDGRVAANDSAPPNVAAPPVSAVSAIVGVGPDREGLNWNHRELYDHLVRQGVSIDFGPASHWGGVWFVDAAEDVEVSHHDIAVSHKCVSVNKLPSSTAAHDAAGLAGVKGWSWGRFSFRATEEGRPVLDRIRKALGG